MKKYLVLKTTGAGNRTGRSAVVVQIEEKKSKPLRVAGNIPELYHGMIVEMEQVKGKVIDYIVPLSEENERALQKAGVDKNEYAKKLMIHQHVKDKNVGWNSLDIESSNLYNALSFKDADVLHKQLVNNAEDTIRLKAINKKIIDNARNRRKIAYKIEEYLGYFDAVEQEGAYQQLMISLKMLCLKASNYGIQGGMVWDNEMKLKEDFVRKDIKSRGEFSLLTAKEIKEFIATAQDRGLEKEQLDTVWCLKTSLPCIITGGAGTGKTTVIKTLIDAYTKYYNVKQVLLIAPTGRASRRLSKKTSLPASTIHRALRKSPEDDYVYYNSDRPLPYQLIIIDESSMIDTSLMYDLLTAVDETSKIIFVGDHNQLYPVGYGEPFFEFMKYMEVYRLTINHRQKSGTQIWKVAQNALTGDKIESCEGVLVKNIDFMEIGDIVLTNNENTQIITPYNELNAQINEYMKKGDCDFNLGDKVMTIKNTADYCNGDIGIVTSVKNNEVVVRMDDTDYEGNVRYCTIDAMHRRDLVLAYAITVHKMQGSEADRVIVILPSNDTAVTKRMKHTAYSRAQRQLEIYFYEEDREVGKEGENNEMELLG